MKPAGKSWDVPIKSELIILGVIAFVALCLRLTFLHEPFETDEGIYGYIGQEILKGSIPYKDVIDIKPPGIYYLYAFAVMLFGNTSEGIRVFTAIYSILTLGLVFWIARYVYGSSAGIIAALLYALYSCSPLIEGSSSNSEVFMVLPIVAGVSLFLLGVDRRKRSFLVGSGICGAVAILIKTVALPYVALLFTALFFVKQSDTRLTDRLWNVVSFLTPFLVIGGFTLLFFHFHGALDSFIYWNFSLPIIYRKGEVVASHGFLNVMRVISPELLLLAVVALPTAVWLLVAQRDFKSVLVALLLPVSCLGVWLPGKFFPHYFIQLFPFLALLTGIGLARLMECKGASLAVAGPIIAAAFGYYVWNDYKYFATLSSEEVSIAKYGKLFTDSISIADHIKKRTDPSDYIFQWGTQPELYFLADRRSPVPHISTLILVLDKNPWSAVLQMIECINTKKPKYIIVKPTENNYPGETALREILSRDYYFETSVGYAIIYKRLSPA